MTLTNESKAVMDMVKMVQHGKEATGNNHADLTKVVYGQDESTEPGVLKAEYKENKQYSRLAKVKKTTSNTEERAEHR